MHNLGCLAFDQEDYAAARDWLTQGLTWRSAYDNLGFVHALAEFATLAAAEGLPETALRLAGATAALTQRTGIVVQHSELGRYERWLATARQALREEVAAAAWAEGQEMPLGQAIGYLLRHWKPLMLFLRKAGAPLDNNIAERALKRAILHRKNALFYRTLNGAQVGDLFMSLIHTCQLCGANSFDYLIELQRHAQELAVRPAEWMPWNYRETLERTANHPDPT